MSRHVVLSSNGFTHSTVASSPCLQRRCLGNERGAVRLGSVRHGVNTASPTPGAVWRHRGMLRRNRFPILLRDVIAFTTARKSCLPVGYLATLCCVTQQWVDMSQYVPPALTSKKSAFCPRAVNEFYMILGLNDSHFPKQYEPFCLYNGDAVCFLWVLVDILNIYMNFTAWKE
jgi:hypothetical protein